MVRAIHAVSDWSDDDIEAILLRASELMDGAVPTAVPGALIGMCFFQTSLRTRVGFEAAAHRLEARFVEAVERRSSAESMPERIEDTIRVMSGYCDTLIVRSPRLSRELAESARPRTGWLNAGDSLEHPTQSLIDVFAIERLSGPLAGARIAIVGDLRMRSVRSLLSFLGRRPPAALVVVSSTELLDRELPVGALSIPRVVDLPDVEPDVVYLAGIPHGAASEEVRTRLRLDRSTLARFSPESVVLSPLPLIDEIASNARSDPRIRWFDQSDAGLLVRVAILERLLSAPRPLV